MYARHIFLTTCTMFACTVLQRMHQFLLLKNWVFWNIKSIWKLTVQNGLKSFTDFLGIVRCLLQKNELFKGIDRYLFCVSVSIAFECILFAQVQLWKKKKIYLVLFWNRDWSEKAWLKYWLSDNTYNRRLFLYRTMDF